MGTKCYRAEVIAGGANYRSEPYPTRERAASALPRLLSTRFWHERLACTELPMSWGMGIVEEDGPAGDRHPVGLDLSHFAEGVRRQLYDQVVVDFFSPRLHRGDVAPWPPYSPEDAQLEVFYLGGRWLVTWKRLDLEDGDEEERTELLRIFGSERGITYQEV